MIAPTLPAAARSVLTHEREILNSLAPWPFVRFRVEVALDGLRAAVEGVSEKMKEGAR
jgi:hypothetical protein